MLDIFKPENDKKRLIVLLIVFVIVAVLSLVYRNVFLSHVEAPVAQNGDNLQKTASVSDATRGTLSGEVPITQAPEDIQKRIDEQKASLPQPPPLPTPEDLKKMSEEVNKNNTQTVKQ